MATGDFSLLRNVRSLVGHAIDERTRLIGEQAKHSAEIAAMDAAAATAAATGDAQGAQANQARADALRKSRGALAEQLIAVDARVREQIDRLIDRVDPCDAEADVPLALFPVRLETRFGAQGGTLRIRIYPDDIHVDQLDRGLSDDEQTAGRAYWTAIWSADDAAVATAWRGLVDRVHADRAGWVATALTPTNVAKAGPDTTPEFRPVGPRARRAAVARLLPDRFVAVAVQAGVRSQAPGNSIPSELVVGLLSDDGTPFITSAVGAKVANGAQWLVDYDQAVANGMAITLQLAHPNQPIDQLFVFGVRSSLDVDRTRAALEDQLRGHRFTRGLSFIPQGTPTNNTESDRADWQGKSDPAQVGRAVAAPAVGANAAVLASALGVDPLTFAGVDHGDEREQPRAHAANVALWPASWGGLLDRVTTITSDKKKLTDEMREDARVFFRDFVRGRGPIPAVRIGNQPYGVLPVGSLDSQAWRPERAVPLDASLLNLLRGLRIKWRQSLTSVPRIDRGGPTLDTTLLDVLGSSPVLQGLRVRSVITDGPALIASDATGGPSDAQVLEQMIEQIVLAELVLHCEFDHPVGSLAKSSRPLSLPLVHASDPGFIDQLLAGKHVAVASVLQALLVLSWNAIQKAIDQAAPADSVGRLVARADALPSNVRETVRALASSAPQRTASELHAGADLVAAHVGESGARVLAEHAPVASLRSSLGDLALRSTSIAAATELSSLAIGAWLRGQAKMAELRDALGELRTVPDEARFILVAETLDLASHRLDAWLTGLVERRRARLRVERPTGLVIGAYGWVENLVPNAQGARDGGYVHAPSVAHATTAGLLRNAYLTHNPDASGNGAFAVDLSSARVRTAIDLLDGMRQGQTLGALLGYRIERAMHEAHLDRFILSLRAFAPLVDGRLTTRGEAVPKPASDTVAATNVVDGASLVDMYPARWAQIVAALNQRPENNPYLPPGPWVPMTPGEQGAVENAIKSAIAANDALADLLLAESVHQLAQGNTGRAAAALDVAGSGDAPPVEPTVVQTPVQGTPFTHRLIIIADAGDTGWTTTRPRAKAEPRLEAWAGARLGSPSVVVVHVAGDGTRTTLDASGLAALDIVYESADRVRLEQRIRAAIPSIPEADAFVTQRDPAWPAALRTMYEIGELAASLRATLVAARPAIPGDFTRASDKPLRAVDSADLAVVRARAVEARGGLAAALGDVRDALAPVGGAPVVEATVNAAIEQLAAYGVSTARVTGDALATIAQLAIAEATRRIDAADAVLAATFDAHAATLISQAIFGDGFWMVPAIGAAPGGDLLSAALGGAVVNPRQGQIRRLLRDVASVRENVAHHTESLLLGDAIDRHASLRVAQLAAAGTPGADRWVGGTLDLTEPTPDRPVTDLVLEAPATFDGTQPAVALVIDQWVDVVPRRERRGEDPATATVDERITSGLAVNAAAPSARAPQAILLAISPDGSRWTTDALFDTLVDTLDLAKIRAVTLEQTNGIARLLPALYEQSWSLQGEPVLDLNYIAKNPVISAIIPYVKETP